MNESEISSKLNLGLNNLINILGESLAGQTKLGSMPSKGFIRLAIKDDFGDKNIDIKDLKYMLKNGLKNRLIKLKVPNYDDVLLHLEHTLMENQSVLTLSNF